MDGVTHSASRLAPLALAAALLAPACGGGGNEQIGSDTGTDPAHETDATDAAFPDASDVEEDGPSDADEEPDNGCIGEDAILDTGGDAPMDGPTDGEPDHGTDDAEDVADWGDLGPFTCGELLLDPRDGRTYETVLIGSQCWMAENLDVGTLVAGATRQTDNGLIEKFCYDDDPANCATYGALYEWDEMMDYGPSDAANPSRTRGICPPGWHVPSDEEWKSLEIHLGMTSTEADMVNAWRGVGVGTALKAGGSTGYDALLTGRNAGGVFSLLGISEYMYTSTEYGTNAWRRCLTDTADTVGRWNTFPKSWGLPVRCVLD